MTRSDATEQRLSAAHGAGDHREVARLLLEAYGEELTLFLRAKLCNEEDARDAYQIFCEQMWRSLPQFRGESSFRTWAYVLTRRAMARILRCPHRRDARRLPLSVVPSFAWADSKTSTETAPAFVARRVALIRDELAETDRRLIALRIDRGLTWPCIARVLYGADLSDSEVRARAAALRKRFQRLKDHLRSSVESQRPRSRAATGPSIQQQEAPAEVPPSSAYSVAAIVGPHG